MPNAQIAVRGRFLFVLEGPTAWLELAKEMVMAALAQSGIGAKTRSGYGFFHASGAPADSADPEAPALCPWVDDTIKRLMEENRAKEDETLRGRALAEALKAIEDPELKNQALADIRARWQAKNWWDHPSGGPPGMPKPSMKAAPDRHSTD